MLEKTEHAIITATKPLPALSRTLRVQAGSPDFRPHRYGLNPHMVTTAGVLLLGADDALYAAKQTGKN